MMTPTQRAAAERLSNERTRVGGQLWGAEVVALLRELLAEPVINHKMTTEPAEPQGEPAAWIQPDHLQKARVAPFLCRVEPTKRMSDFVPLYAHPPQQRKPPREQITAAAKALCRQASTACNVDFDDNWKVYGDNYIADATAALNAAYGIGEAP